MAELLILSLGSNLGDRTLNLQQALGELRKEVGQLLAISSLYETEPVGVGGHPPYFNLVVVFSTESDPETILNITQHIEQTAGRKAKGDLCPRPIDIDIISFGSRQIRNDRLQLPHPRMHLRKFVLLPLSEVCPDWSFPGNGKSLQELLASCPDSTWIKKLGHLRL